MAGERPRLHHREAGAGDPIVLIHGVPGQGAVWASVAERLARDFRVITVDLLGFGESARPTNVAAVLPEPQAAALEATFDQLDLHDATLVGHDLGGSVAVLAARKHPSRVARIGLIASDVLADSRPPVSLSFLGWPVLGRPLERFTFGDRTLRRLVGQMAITPDRPVDVDRWVGDAEQQCMSRALLVELIRNRRRHLGPVESALGDLDLPATVVWGQRDPFTPASTARRVSVRLPRGRPTVIDGAGHLLPAERPDEVAHAVRDLVARPRGR